jgi:virginiamycin B lyase
MGIHMRELLIMLVKRTTARRRMRRVGVAKRAFTAFALLGFAGVLPNSASATPSSSANNSFLATSSSSRDVLAYGNFLYWTNTWSGTIGRSNLDGSGVNQNFVTGLVFPSGIDIEGGFLYFTSFDTVASASEVGRANIDGTGVNSNFITGGTGTSSVEATSSFLYWSNSENNTIGRSNLDGTNVNQAFIVTGARPWNVVANATTLYWSNTNNNTIGTSTIAGANVNQSFIVLTAAEYVTGLTLSSTHIYWAGYNGFKIGRASLSGTNVEPDFVAGTGITDPVGISVTGNYLYWSRVDHDVTLRTLPATIGRTSFDPDVVNPLVSITSPTVGQTFPGAPVAISGTASDDTALSAVFVAIYRNVAGGQYWNGSAWQSANVAVPAVLSAPTPLSGTWTYAFNAPPGGSFAVAALSYDTSGNYAVAPYRTFAVADAVKPSVTLVTPTPSQALSSRPVIISGSASDNAGVGDVQISIYRPMDPAGRFWNGTAWQTAYATVPAVLSNPGSSTTTYTYSFNPPQSGGYFYVAAVALDTSYGYNVTPFTLFTLPDAVAPSAVILNPVAGPTSGALSISGTATDNVAINRVAIAIYQASTGLYWNGTGWQSAFTTIPTNLAAPGALTTAYSFTYTPPAPGSYYIAVVPVDGNYNYSLTPFTIVTHT